MKSLLALAAATIILLASTAHAATYYVDQKNPAASDSNPGTASLPWKTINKATQTAVAGDTIIVKEGVYREAPSLKNSGTAANPITLKGQPGKRVVVTGADAIANWTQCTLAIAKNNPNFANIYFSDIAWKPTILVQDETVLPKARDPNHGWWMCQGGTTTTMVDAVHLTQPSGYWVGAEVFLWDVSITSQYSKTITAYDQPTHTITVGSVWNSAQVPVSSDRYFLLNRVEIIDTEGEWAAEDLGNGSYRVYVWTTGGGSPASHLMQGSRRGRFVIEWGNKSYWTVDSLELCYNQGHGVGCWSTGNLGHNIVQNCSLHHNDGTGIYGRFNPNGLYRRNLIAFNGSGINISDNGGVTVEENEIGDNLWDGMDANANDTIIRRNYIHGHWIWGHADNIQTWGGVSNFLIEDNLILNGGQSYMMEGLDGITFRGNAILSCNAYMLIFGHSNARNGTIEFNTLCWPGYGIFNFTDRGYHLKNNIFVEGHSGVMWGGVSDSNDYASDYNLFFHAQGLPSTSPCVVWNSSWSLSLAQYVAQSGRDTHSAYGDPKFANVPYSTHQCAYGKNNDFRNNRIYLNSTGDLSLISVGDHVEMDFDGVVRTVTAKGSDYVEVAPADDRLMDKYATLADWREKTNFTLDLALDPSSPARAKADDGSDLGARLSVPQFMAGDFNGDGLRDVPSFPYVPPGPPVIALATDFDWVYQNTPVATADKHLCLLTITVGPDPAGPQAYSTSVTERGGAGMVAVNPTADPMVWQIVGGRRGAVTPGDVTIDVAVTGLDSGQTANASTTISVRLLGDINVDGSLSALDKAQLTKRLNGLDVTYPDRSFDLNIDGFVNAADKALLTKILNDLPVN